MREHGGGNDGGILDAHAVMDFVAILQAAQNGNGVLDGRLGHQNRLEAALQCGIFLDVLFVFVEGGGADGTEFAARKGGLQHVGAVHGAFSSARADQGVHFVDEENDLALRFGDFFQDGFEAIFEFTAEFCPGNQGGQIQRDNELGLEHVGNVAGDDALGEAFDDGGFAHAGFADEHRIIFGAAREDLHDAADFLVAADDRIEFGAASQIGEIAGVFLQRGVRGFGILRGDALIAADACESLQDGFVSCAVLFQQLAGGIAVLSSDSQKKMFGGDVLVLEIVGFLLRAFKNLIQGAAEMLIREALHFGQAPGFALEILSQSFGTDAKARKKRRHNSIDLLIQCGKKMDRFYSLVFVACSDFLSGLESVLGLHSHFVETQHVPS